MQRSIRSNYGEEIERILSERMRDVFLQIAEIEALKKECAESELTIRGSLQRSRAATPSELLGAYEQIEGTVHAALASLQGGGAAEDDAERAAERMVLLAEYELDFAMLAASRALLIALTAIDFQLAQERKEETSDARS